MGKLYKYFILLSVTLGLMTIKTNYLFAQLTVSAQNQVTKYDRKAKEYQEKGNNAKAAKYFYEAGMICFKNKANEETIDYLTKAKNLNLKIKNFSNAQTIYSHLSIVNLNMNKNDEAMKNIEEGLKIRKKFGTKADYAAGLLDMAYVFAQNKDYTKAIEKVKKAYNISLGINDNNLIITCLKRLEKYYRLSGNNKKSSKYAQKIITFRNISQNQKKQNKEAELAIQKKEMEVKNEKLRLKEIEKKLDSTNHLVEIQIKERINDSLETITRLREDSINSQKEELKLVEKQKLVEKKLRIKEAETNRKQKQILTIFFIVIPVIITLIIIITISRRILKKKKASLEKAVDEIQEINKNINYSINYAKEIQKVFLPKQSDLNSVFKNAFIFFKPRDAVSGDYFWFTKILIENTKGVTVEKNFAAAIDCTGHGVPGAFLSITSFHMMETIVHEKKIHEPAKILDALHDKIRSQLNQYETKNRDGMDMAIIAYTPNTRELQFAGAKNPLILIQNNKLKRIKGDIKPIGGEIFDITENRNFKQHNIIIDTESSIFLYSDGFADQLGGPKNRKYMQKRFLNFLFSIHKKPQTEQYNLINEEFKNWKGKQDQIDDTLIIGINIKP